MDKVPTVKVFKPVLIWVVGVGATVEIHRRRILPTLLVTSVLRNIQYTCYDNFERTYAVTLLVEHKRSYGPTGVGTSTGLTMNADGSTAPAVLVLSPRNGTSGHWHDRVSGSGVEVEITRMVDEGTTSQWCSLYPFPVRTIARPERTDHLVSSGSSPTSITEPHHFSV